MAAAVAGCDQVAEGTWLWRSPAVTTPQNKTPTDNQDVTSPAGGGQDAGRQDGPQCSVRMARVQAQSAACGGRCPRA